MPYQKTTVTLTPFSETAADLLAALLGEIGYESFEPLSDGVAAYIPQSLSNATILQEQLLKFPMEGVALHSTTETIPDQDWNHEWEKNYFKPIVIGSECVIHSSFHQDVPAATYDIVIDPKMAFGTGHHQTTELMVQSLLGCPCKGRSLLDMGCGTAILAILAAMKGAEKITAIDIDPWAFRNAQENVMLNRIAPIDLRCGGAEQLGSDCFDIVLANINRNILLQDMAAYAAVMHSGSLLYLSGFYLSDIPAIEKEAARCGFVKQNVDEKENWAVVCFIKK